MLDLWQSRLEAAVAANARDDDGAHDLGHLRRVWRNVQHIADRTAGPVDRMVLVAAAYLHDIVILEKNHPRRSEASRLAGARAQIILWDLGFPHDQVDAVVHAIEAHSYSGGIEPATIEAKILQDADRIEALGAIGLARMFHVGGRMGTKLFHGDDPLAKRRPLDDRAYSLDHFYTKILSLPERMNTAPGRELAIERVKIIQHYVACLLKELGAAPSAV